MVKVGGVSNRSTLSFNSFVAAANSLPSMSITLEAHQQWSEGVNSMVATAEKLFDAIQKTEPKDETGKLNLNQYMRSKGFFIAPTSLVALARKKIPAGWRVGDGKKLAIMFSVFCSTMALVILHKAGDDIDDSGNTKTKKIVTI
jgi:hypothetical protein